MERRTFLLGAATAAAAATASKMAAADTLPLGPIPINLHFPEPGVETVDKRFAKYVILGAEIERIATGFRTAEGPVYFGDGGYLLWSDIPNNRIMRWSEDDGHVSVFRQPSGYANGNTRDREGRLITCEHDNRRITRTEHDGSITVVMDKFNGKPLNSPNDVAVDADGGIWFSDPGSGIRDNYQGHIAKFELPIQVYRVDGKTGKAKVVTDELIHPNGLAFSPDGKKLYIICTAKNGKSNIQVYDVKGDSLSNGRPFVSDFGNGVVQADPSDTHAAGSGTDGMRVDIDGNVWCSINGGGKTPEPGVRCYAPDGALLGKIHLPETANNLCFGGKHKNRLFICGHTSMYSVYTNAQGAMVP